MARLLKCETWKRAAKALPIIPDAEHRDHPPLVATSAYTLEAVRPPMRQRWNFDTIAKALATEKGKRDFIVEVEAEMTANTERLHHLSLKPYPEGHAEAIWEIIHRVGAHTLSQRC